MLLDTKLSKSGKALVLTDPNGEVHACTSGDELWETITALLNDPEQPEIQSQPAPGPRNSRRGPGPAPDPEDGFDGPDDLVDELLGRGLQSLIGGIRRASFRGGKKGGRRPTVHQEEPQDDDG